MIEPSNISHILSDVDVLCDKFPSDFPSERLEEMRRVGKSTMTRLFTSMVHPYGANISGYG